ncbi:MAG: hypothetical protein QM765_52825 [Myxococcales bacterium]
MFGTTPESGFSEEPTDFAPDRSLFGAPAPLAEIEPAPQAAEPVPEPSPVAPPAPPATPEFISLPDEPSTGEVPLAAASEFVTFENTAPAEEVAFGAVQMDPSMVEQVTPGQWQDPSAVQALELPPDDSQVELASAHEFMSYQPVEPARVPAAPAPGEGVIPVGIYTPPPELSPEPVLELAEAEIAPATSFEMAPPEGTLLESPPEVAPSPAPAYPPPAFAVSVPPTAPPAPAPAPVVVVPAPVVAALPPEWEAPAPIAAAPAPFAPAPMPLQAAHPMSAPTPFQPAPVAPPRPPSAWGQTPAAPPVPAAIPARQVTPDLETIEEIEVIDDEPLRPAAAPAPIPAPAPVAARPPAAPFAPHVPAPAPAWPPPAAPPAPTPFARPQVPMAPMAPVVPAAAPRLNPAIPRPVAPMPVPAPGRPVGPAPAAPAQSAIIAGEHRVIVHTLEGQVKRGTMRNVNLDGESLDLEVYTGQPPERLPTKRLKAVFFLLAPGAKPLQPSGNKLRVTFHDERQVAGFAPAYRPEDNGFFMFPADARTNTARIYIYRSAVKSIARG